MVVLAQCVCERMCGTSAEPDRARDNSADHTDSCIRFGDMAFTVKGIRYV